MAALVFALAPAVHAEQWVVENTLVSSFESNDNTALIPSSPGTMNTFSLSTALSAARKSENSATRVNAGATSVRQWGPGEQDRIDGRFGLTQSLADALNSFELGAQYVHDFNNAVDATDVTVARGRRRSTTLSGGWARSLSERLSANTQLSFERTAYGSPASVNAEATDYHNTALSGGLSLRWTEIDTLSLSATRSNYRTEGDTNRSDTDQINLGLSRLLSERSSASLSIGAYRTKTQALRSRIYCPLAVSQCLAGLLPFQVATDRVESADRGLQFSLSGRYQLDEVTDLALSAARQQQPSGAGAVVRNDSVHSSLNHNFSPTLSGRVSFMHSRSSYQGAVGAAVQPSQQTVSVSFAKQLGSDLSLQAGYRFSRADGTLPGQGARSNSVSLGLQYDWPRLDMAR